MWAQGFVLSDAASGPVDVATSILKAFRQKRNAAMDAAIVQNCERISPRVCGAM